MKTYEFRRLENVVTTGQWPSYYALGSGGVGKCKDVEEFNRQV